MKFKIIKDTREQQGWNFPVTQHCSGMEIGTLKTGDYAIKGYENVICIERKKSVEELAMNLGRNYATFLREIERMAEFSHAFIICEFRLADLIEYPKNSKIPQKFKYKIKIRGPYLLKRLSQIQLDTEVKILFCDNAEYAATTAYSLMKEIGVNL